MKVGGRGCVEYENRRGERRILDASGVRAKKKKSRRAMQSLRSRWEDNGGGGKSRRKSARLCWWVALRLKIESISSVNTGFRLIAQFSCQLNDLNKHNFSIWPLVLFSFYLIWLPIETFCTCYVSCSIRYVFFWVCVDPRKSRCKPSSCQRGSNWINKEERHKDLKLACLVSLWEYEDSRQQLTMNSTK